MSKHISRFFLLILLASLSMAVIPYSRPPTASGVTVPSFTLVDTFDTDFGNWFSDLDDQGRLYVANNNLDAILIFDPNGTLIDTITGFDNPIGVYVHGNRIYVTDIGTDNVTILENQVQVDTISVTSPRDVAVDDDGNIYITVAAGSVFIYDNNLAPTGTLLDPLSPYGIEIGPQGRIFVADFNANSFWIYSPDLELIGQVGTGGSGPGEFSILYDIAVDVDGYIYAVDDFNDNLQVFSPDFQVVAIIADLGSVHGVNVDGNGRVYITDWSLGDIDVYETSDLGDQDGPVISNIAIAPVNPVGGQPVMVTAQVSDLTGIHNVTVSYTATSGSTGTIVLTMANATYSGMLPSFTVGDQVEFTITAEDSSLARHTSYSPTQQFNVGSAPLIPGIDSNLLAVGGLGLAVVALIVALVRGGRGSSKKKRH